METFKNDDLTYLAWHGDHPTGFVLNHFGGTNPTYNVLHKSRCSFLWRDIDEGSRTIVAKWCSESEEELAMQANSVLGSRMWKKCGVCFSRSATDGLSQSSGQTAELDFAGFEGEVWVSGEPAVWLGSGEKEWKQKVTSVLSERRPETQPQWLDFELQLPAEKLYTKDLDNMLTPLLESARDSGWVKRGFGELGSVTARKVAVSEESKAGVRIRWQTNVPLSFGKRTGILVESELTSLDADTVKWDLYEKAFELYELRSDLRFPPLYPILLDIHVTVNNEQRRKSIQALMKPYIDGLEPILGHPDNLLPQPRKQLQRRLAPQDEMVVVLTFHVRGGDSNCVSVLMSPAMSG